MELNYIPESLHMLESLEYFVNPCHPQRAKASSSMCSAEQEPFNKLVQVNCILKLWKFLRKELTYPKRSLMHCFRCSDWSMQPAPFLPGKIGILRTLAAEDHVSATRLSQVIGVSQQAISLTTKELESLGLIERHKDDSDRRKLWFRLTKTGQQKLDSEVQQGREALKQAIGNKLSDKELKLIHDAIPALTKIKTAAKR